MRGWIAAASAAVVVTAPAVRTAPVEGACFILYEIGVGEIGRNPSSTCTARVSPQSTFKIPHALAALDSGVVADVDELVKYDGRPVDQALWRQDHTLATAMHYSVVWYFQEIARRLGPEREREYLTRFDYGNRNASSGLTSFWLGGSLEISPEEQLAFLRKLFDDKLPASATALTQVKAILRQPAGSVVNATGVHPFGGTWAGDVVLSAKTGSGPTSSGGAVRWLVGHVRRGPRAWIFVSNVVGGNQTPAMAAVDQAAAALEQAHVLR